MITLNIYIPLLIGILAYKLVEPLQGILKFRFNRIYPFVILIMILLNLELILFYLIVAVVVLEFIYYFVSFFKEREEMSWFKIHFLALSVLIFIILISTIDKNLFFFQVLLFLPVSFFYAIVILLGEKYFKGNIFGVVGLD